MAESSVTISPDVIRTIVRNTVLSMPSVRGLVDYARSLRARDNYRGVEVAVADGEVRVQLHLAAARDVSLNELGQHIQTEVKHVVEEIVGLRVGAVDVYFEDVTA
jgi:uncharacterized alkaline shock family protein YloU